MRNVYGIAAGQIWLDNVQCTGTETDIDECSHDDWGVHSSRHYEDVAISCTTGNRVSLTAVKCANWKYICFRTKYEVFCFTWKRSFSPCYCTVYMESGININAMISKITITATLHY